MRICSGMFIKHKRFLDICCLVKDSFDYGHGYKLKCQVWNMMFQESIPLNINVNFNIAKTEEHINPKSNRLTTLKDWQYLPRSKVIEDRCYRDSEWENIL